MLQHANACGFIVHLQAMGFFCVRSFFRFTGRASSAWHMGAHVVRLWWALSGANVRQARVLRAQFIILSILIKQSICLCRGAVAQLRPTALATWVLAARAHIAHTAHYIMYYIGRVCGT